MKDPREPRQFECFDDDPRNNGNGYNHPNPYDDPDDLKVFDREEENEIPDDDFDNDWEE